MRIFTQTNFFSPPQKSRSVFLEKKSLDEKKSEAKTKPLSKKADHGEICNIKELIGVAFLTFPLRRLAHPAWPTMKREWSEICAQGAQKNVCKLGSFLVIFSNKAYMRVKIILRKS